MVSQNRSRVAVLAAWCLFLSTIEYLLPKPLPFLRLGLANAPLILAAGLRFLPFSSFMALAALKCLSQSLVSGSLFSYVFILSAGGTAASALLMALLARTRRCGMPGLGIAGAFASNIAQLSLARLFLPARSIMFIAPPFLAAGLVTGAALGIFAARFAETSRYFALKAPPSRAAPPAESETMPAPQRRFHYIPLFLSFLGITLLNCAPPAGRVLFVLGSFPVTAGALLFGLKKAALFCSLMLFSQLFFRFVPASSPVYRKIPFLGAVFTLFSFINGEVAARRQRFQGKNRFEELDNLLFMMENRYTAFANDKNGEKTEENTDD